MRSSSARFTVTVLSATVTRRVDEVITDAAGSCAQVHDALTVVAAVVRVTRVFYKPIHILLSDVEFAWYMYTYVSY